MTAKNMLKKTTNWKSLALIIGACFLIAAPQVAAQNYGNEGGHEQQGQYQPPQQQQVEINSEDLENFVEAQKEVDKIRTEYSKELGQTDDTDKARKLQDKYSGQMVESIQEKGLSVQKFNEISLAMQQNPELRQKVQEMAD